MPGTSQNDEIFSRIPSGTGKSLRQMMASGWMPIPLSSFTLCCVGLVFNSLTCSQVREQGEVDVEDVVAAHVVAYLADGLQEWEALDVADGAANFDDHHVDLGVLGQAYDLLLDFVGDVGDGLDGASEEVAPAFLGDQAQIDVAGGEVRGPGEFYVDKSFVVAQVQVGLASVGGNEDLAVLVGRHGAGVDVEVGVELHNGDG